MALTVGEACAVNVLIDALYRHPRDRPNTVWEEIDKAAKTLAESANKRLMAGWRSDDITPQARRFRRGVR